MAQWVRPGTLPDLLERKARTATATVRTGLDRVGDRAAAEMRARAPRRTGRYAAGIRSDTTVAGDTVTVTAGSTSPDAGYVEQGRPAGRMPPVAVIMAVFNIPRVEAFPLARAIGQRGTPGYHVVADSKRALAPFYDLTRRDIIDTIGDLDDGRI